MKFETIGIDQNRNSKKNQTSSFNLEIFLLTPKIGIKRKIAFYNELGMLLNSGIELSKAINLIKDQEDSQKIAALYDRIEKSLIQGKSLSFAMESCEVFSKYDIFSVHAGEETRMLPKCLINLEHFYTRRLDFMRKIMSLLSYPTFVLVITFGVLYFMLNYVVPMFSNIFRQFGNELPAITQIVIYFSSIFDKLMLGFVAGVIILLALHRYFRKNPTYRNIIDQMLLKIPYIGKLIKNLVLLKYFELMALLLKAKVPLRESLNMSLATISFNLLKINIQEVVNKVEKGYTVSEVLDTRLFNRKIVTLIKIGEEVNQLDEVFANLASYLNSEIDHQINMIGKVMEPLILIIIAFIVGFILIAMYYPMFNLSQVINN